MYLYEELNLLRTRDIEQVLNQITKEVQKGEHQRRQVVKARLRGVSEGVNDLNARSKGEYTLSPIRVYKKDINLGSKDSGLSSASSPSKCHTLSSISLEMEQACQHIEAEIATSETEVLVLKEEIENTIDALGDLKHGRSTKAT